MNSSRLKLEEYIQISLLPSSLWIFALTEMTASKGNTRSSKQVPVRVSMKSSIVS